MGRNSNVILVFAGLALPGLLGVGSDAVAYPRPSHIERVSLNVDGTQFHDDSGYDGFDDGLSGVSMSPDGRFVAFVNTVPVTVTSNDPAAVASVSDVYLRDRLRGRTVKVSVANDGGLAARSVACSGADEPAVSADGRYVAFVSCYGDLTKQSTPGSTGLHEIYVRDMRAGETTLVSLNVNGLPLGGQQPTISDDGRRVAFASSIGCVQPLPCNLDPTGSTSAILVRDIQRRTTTIASVNSAGDRANGASKDPTISPDGRFVLFVTTASNLSDVDTNAAVCLDAQFPTCDDAYMHDLVTGRTELISVGLDGQAAGANYGYRGQMISRDDRYVAFQSQATNIVPAGSLPRQFSLYVRDRRTGRSERATVDSAGAVVGSSDDLWSLSEDGRYLAFDQYALSCKRAASGIHDLLTGATTPVGFTESEASYCGSKDANSATRPHVSANGRFVAFTSVGGKLVPGDTNEVQDVFVQDRGTALGIGVVSRSHVVGAARSGGADALLDVADDVGETSAVWSELGGDVIGASAVVRPATDDVFVRLAVDHMPLLTMPSLVNYGVGFDAGGRRYQVLVRCLGWSGAATTTLSEQVAGQWQRVGLVEGHCGTTGQEVVASIPMSLLTSQRTIRVSGFEAFTGIESNGRLVRLDNLRS